MTVRRWCLCWCPNRSLHAIPPAGMPINPVIFACPSVPPFVPMRGLTMTWLKMVTLPQPTAATGSYTPRLGRHDTDEYFSGFTFSQWDDFLPSTLESEFPGYCRRWITPGSSLDPAVMTGRDPTLIIHDAWTVAWAAADRSTLTPELPAITNNMRVPTWTPGEIIPKGKYDNPSEMRMMGLK